MIWNLQIKKSEKLNSAQQVTCAVIVSHFPLRFQYAFLLPLNIELFLEVSNLFHKSFKN